MNKPTVLTIEDVRKAWQSKGQKPLEDQRDADLKWFAEWLKVRAQRVAMLIPGDVYGAIDDENIRMDRVEISLSSGEWQELQQLAEPNNTISGSGE